MTNYNNKEIVEQLEVEPEFYNTHNIKDEIKIKLQKEIHANNNITYSIILT